ncbi:MAG TPA: M48 family metallopeptidase [Tepidisphaeraceae bacterium]|nr:M48 family metallopeptidase [Tepidisphaeraceae bacterium]
MSRFLILFLFLIWTAWPGSAQPVGKLPLAETTLFLGVFALIVLLLGAWSRILARHVTGANLHRSLKRFNQAIFAARLAIPGWFGVGVFVLDWPLVVERLLGPVAYWPVQLPAAALGTLPAVLAWMALWWSQYPADRALREQSLLIHLEDGLPVHAPPGFWEYFRASIRLQLLFTVVPVALILLARDVMIVTLWKTQAAGPLSPATDAMVSFASALLVLIFAPEILRRVLHTQPLPASPLRDRLENLCRRANLRYREILLWRTENNMGNAAVMGLLPRVRYILLSDLLLESMRDEQIEAVFAHEVGHVVHRHMGWYVVFFVILTLAMTGASATLINHFAWVQLPPWLPPELLVMAGSVAAFLLMFGFLSRNFERQADVFAARTIETGDGIRSAGTASDGVESDGVTRSEKGAASYSVTPSLPTPSLATPSLPSRRPVGPYGATVFASALHRVAVINNIPVAARSWCHGSIARRMKYLEHLAADPSHTTRFDRFMGKLYAAMVIALVACGAWVFVAG